MVLSLSCHGQSQVAIVIGSDGQALGIIQQLYYYCSTLAKRNFQSYISGRQWIVAVKQRHPLAPGGQPNH